ncbi:MAG: phosphatase PAP2 family protein [Proteobacteria bacterium]|nr:phosphatase PAP2 family protein [Pseudomonadota bacterium]
MTGAYDWGVDVVLWFQRFSPALDLPFKLVTFMGDEPFFLILLPLIYWCFDRRTGVRLTVLFLASAYVNAVVKEIFAQPRPFQYDARVRPIVMESGFGFPSGHTQGAAVVWGYLAWRLRRPWAWVAAVLLVLLIPLSRIYLGVHFPTDLLGGYLIGAALLAAYIGLAPRVEAWFAEKGIRYQLLASVIAPGLMILAYPGEGRYGVATGAALMGMSLGFALERRWVGFLEGGPWFKRALRLVLGLVVMTVIYIGLKIVLAGLRPESLFRFFRYLLVGLWGGFGAPWLFVRANLASRQPGHTSSGSAG